jgi:hypothetical protein
MVRLKRCSSAGKTSIGNMDKALYQIITRAAALANWYAAILKHGASHSTAGD